MDSWTWIVLGAFGAVCVLVAIGFVWASARLLPMTSAAFSVDPAVVRPEKIARVGDVRLEVVSGTLWVTHRRNGIDCFIPSGKDMELRGAGWLIGSVGGTAQVWVHQLRKRSVWRLQPGGSEIRDA